MQPFVTCRRQDPPLYPFGHGLSFTTFSHSDLSVSTQATFPADATHTAAAPGAHVADALPFGANDQLHVRVRLTNTGAVRGRWPVLLFVGDDFCIVPPSPRMLKGFSKLDLAPGESASVHFQVCLSHA